MNSLISLHSFASPYLKAGCVLYNATTSVYKALSGDRAISVYKTSWLLAKLVLWASILAMKQSVRFGQVARKYYEAEWASDVEALVNWILDYTDQCIQQPQSHDANANQDSDAIAHVKEALGATATSETTPIPQSIQVILLGAIAASLDVQ